MIDTAETKLSSSIAFQPEGFDLAQGRTVNGRNRLKSENESHEEIEKELPVKRDVSGDKTKR